MAAQSTDFRLRFAGVAFGHQVQLRGVPGIHIVGVVDLKKLLIIVAGLLAAIVAGGANVVP